MKDHIYSFIDNHIFFSLL